MVDMYTCRDTCSVGAVRITIECDLTRVFRAGTSWGKSMAPAAATIGVASMSPTLKLALGLRTSSNDKKGLVF